MSRLINKIKEVGLINTFTGTLRRNYYKTLQKKYDLDPWHISPYELRYYAQAVAEYVNKQPDKDNEIVDIGCGLGEVIRNIKAANKIGMDINENAITVAKLLDKKNTVKYSVGSFDEFGAGHKVDYLITLGFMHGSREDKWVDFYTNTVKYNDISHVIVDVIPEGYNNAHKLDFTKILPDNYKMTEQMGPFLNGRYVEIYTKQN